MSDALNTIASQIQLIMLDVDGVLTQGEIEFDGMAVESKRFHVRDGLAMQQLAPLGGLGVGILTGRSSSVVERRMHELGVEIVIQGSRDKGADIENIAGQLKITMDQIAFLGDDLPDLPVMRRVGLPMAVADAAAEVRALAKVTLKTPGGHGAAREAIELILKAKGGWDAIVDRYCT